MRTLAPRLLPLFRSELMVDLLSLLLLQPERSWTVVDLAGAAGAPVSSVHREVGRIEDAGLVRRDASARPHRFAASGDPLAAAVAHVLRHVAGVESDLAAALSMPDVDAAVLHGSWVHGRRRPDSDVDVLVIGDASLRALRAAVRPVGERIGRTIDLTLFTRAEWRDMVEAGSSFARGIASNEAVVLVGEVPDR